MKQPINTKLLLLCLFLCAGLLPAQLQTDSLERWMAGFANYNNLRPSPLQRWVMVSKTYPDNRDTVQVFDTERPGTPVLNLVKRNLMQAFLGEKALLVQGQGTAEYITLPDKRKMQYSGVRKTAVLTDLNGYVILDEAGVLTLYDGNAKVLAVARDAEDFVTDGKTTLLAVVKVDGMRSIVKVAAGTRLTLYKTPNRVAPLLKFKTGAFAAFTETEEKTGKIRCVLTDIGGGRCYLPLSGSFTEASSLQVLETPDGKAFLITFEKLVKPSKDAIVNVWYGNDRHLREKDSGRLCLDYLLWRKDSQNTERLPVGVYEGWVPLTSRYFVAFSRGEQFDYHISGAVFPLFLVDRGTGSVKKIAEAAREGAVSSDGMSVVIREEIARDWLLWDVRTGERYRLGMPGLRYPAYTSDGKHLLFESDSGLWQYELSRHRFLPTLLPGHQTRIFAKATENLYERDGMGFTVSTVDVKDGILVQTYSKEDRLSGFYRISRGRTKPLLQATVNHIRQLRYTPGVSKAVTIEESYRTMPAVFLHDLRRGHRVSLSSVQPPQEETDIRQKVISYRNSRGTALKGILYYPQNFVQEKKYPMVVRIYQEQGATANRYPYPDYGGSGFNVRVLTGKGYFVFLPDTVVDDRGAGIAALDCVHNGMDALAGDANIDFERVGLTGHSFGGYETNFIAGHSERFRTYISGAGIGNLTERYFSYNPSYEMNEYSRIETGQFEMIQPFAEAKEKYMANNPVYFAEKVTAPMLLWAGMKDSNVPYDQTTAFYLALVRNRKDVIALFYPTQNHVFAGGTPEIKDLNIRSMEWWDYFLKDRKDIPWIQQQMKKDAF